MELNARRKAMKKKSSTRQAAQDPRSSTQVASSSCTPRDVGGLENLNPNMPSLYAYNPQQNAQGVIFDQHVQRVDTPSSNGVAFYGYNPQRNVQGLGQLHIMEQPHPGYTINQQSMQRMNFGTFQYR
ncbi:uncharacterized protein LOC119999416 isoform X2 [Tripterygium wilfordii]|uniref:uncharacterized protein LOC119999416 isoform X2 n=1 Tax=Tripterygium wilfordii TaxID=458696 RepID=UPI0018F84E00|nr:uncharacterized protein LOC119999416 isoform X2 [Tripterygium wilfordii]